MKEKFDQKFEKVLAVTEKSIKDLEAKIELAAQPARTTLAKRFPVLFTLVATLGLVMIFLGLEQLVLQIPFLYNNPLLILFIGVGILALTGTLYKKLS